MVFAPRGENLPHYKFGPKHVQDVHNLEEKVNIAVMILEANVNVLKLLKGYYEHLILDKDFPWNNSCKDQATAFSDQLNVMIYDLETEISRAKLLNKIIADRKALVTICFQSPSNDYTNKILGIAAHSSPEHGENGEINF